jgi:hypothetical protein
MPPHQGEVLRANVPPMVAVIAGASPYTYTAPSNGFLMVSGGTVSLVQYGRGGSSVPTGLTAGLIPLQKGDSAVITYVVVPSILNFYPSAS